jgi:hypothetical protein
MLTQTVSRLKNQSPKLLIDEYVDKVEKTAAQAGSDAEIQRLMIARMGEQAFWEQQRRLAMYAAAWEDAGATAGLDDQDPLPPLDPPEPDAGPAAEPGDAGAAPPPAKAEPAAEWGVDLSDKTCAQLEHAIEKARLLYREGKYTKEQFGVRDAALRAELARKECRAEGKIVMTQEQLDALIEARKEKVKQTTESLYGDGLARDGLTAGQRKTKLLRSAVLCFGIGFGIMAIALPIAFTVDYGMVSGWFGTAGAVLFFIGLIMLIVVGSKYSHVEKE